MKTQFNIEKTFWTDLNTLRGVNKHTGLGLYVQHTVPSIDEGEVEKYYAVRCQENNIFLGGYYGRDVKFSILSDESESNPTLTASVWVGKDGVCHEADEITHRFLEYLNSQGFITNVVFSEQNDESDEEPEADVSNTILKVLSTDKDITIRVLIETLVEVGYPVDLVTETKVTQEGYTKETKSKVTVDGQAISMDVEDSIIVDPMDVMLTKVIEGKPEGFANHSHALVWRDLVTRWLKEGVSMDVIFD